MLRAMRRTAKCATSEAVVQANQSRPRRRRASTRSPIIESASAGSESRASSAVSVEYRFMAFSLR
jgi:hypothetical protein